MRHSKKFLIIAVGVLLTLGLFLFFVLRETVDAPAEPPQKLSTPEPAQATDAEPPAIFDKQRHSIDRPASLWVITNKQRPLPPGYVPEDLAVPNIRLRLAASHEQMQLAQQAIPALEAMFAAASGDGATLVFGSGYRSYVLQKQFYDGYVARDGQTAADRYSARPGTSEHQTGLAFDATRTDGSCHLEICFADTPQGKWLAEHAYQHGFILRYPDKKEAITGYQYEPWHFRYVGKELASEINHTGLTLEEFFELN